MIDDNGKGLYSTGLGHGDALHLSDLDPLRPGLEVFDIQERFDDAGAHFRDARTGGESVEETFGQSGLGWRRAGPWLGPRHRSALSLSRMLGARGGDHRALQCQGREDLRPHAALVQLRRLVGWRRAARIARSQCDLEMELDNGGVFMATLKAGKWTYTDRQLERMLVEADKRGKDRLKNEPRAAHAEYDPETRRLIIELLNGCILMVPVDLMQGLRGASDKDLADFELMARGFDLHWKALDSQFTVAGLLAGKLGCNDRAQAVAEAYQRGIIYID